MELKPDSGLLMRRELYTLLTISLVVIVSFLIIHVLVVTFDPDVDNETFVNFVWSWVAGGLVAMWVLVPWLLYIWIINLSYSIDDERVVIHKGIITKKNVSIPYSAITDFTLSRSLYERWLDIGTLFIQTAGQGAQAGGHEGKLEGIVDFDSLHNVLREKMKVYRGTQTEVKMAESEPVAHDQDVLSSILDEIKKINRKLN